MAWGGGRIYDCIYLHLRTVGDAGPYDDILEFVRGYALRTVEDAGPYGGFSDRLGVLVHTIMMNNRKIKMHNV